MDAVKSDGVRTRLGSQKACGNKNPKPTVVEKSPNIGSHSPDTLVTLREKVKSANEEIIKLRREISLLNETIKFKDDVISELKTETSKSTIASNKVFIDQEAQVEMNRVEKYVMCRPDCLDMGTQCGGVNDIGAITRGVHKNNTNYEMESVPQKSTTSTTVGYQKCHKRKLLILTDSHGRNMYKMLSHYAEFDIEVIFKPGASLSGVTEDIVNLTKDFQSSDFVFVLGGTNDKYRNFPLKKVREIIKSTTHTNVVIGAVPYRYDKPLLNNNIFEVNLKIFELIQKSRSMHACFLDVNSFLLEKHYTKHGLHLKGSGKFAIVAALMKLVTSINVCPNLITIQCGQATSEEGSRMQDEPSDSGTFLHGIFPRYEPFADIEPIIRSSLSAPDLSAVINSYRADEDLSEASGSCSSDFEGEKIQDDAFLCVR